MCMCIHKCRHPPIHLCLNAYRLAFHAKPQPWRMCISNQNLITYAIICNAHARMQVLMAAAQSKRAHKQNCERLVFAIR